jgi:hypothetical protein
MSVYVRTTRECLVNHIQPALFQAVREYFQTHQLGDPETGGRVCCETIAEKSSDGNLFSRLASSMEGNPDTTIHLAILLTEDWLVWVRSGNQSGTVVNGARLKMIRVKAYVSRRTKAMELEVSGFINDTKEVVRGNLQMGPEPAAQKMCDEVLQAVNKVNPPVKKSFFGLRGG